MPSRRVLRVAACASTVAALLALAPPARADASAWLFVGGGATAWKQASESLSPQGSLSFDLGVGTTPDAAFAVGGLFRMAPILGSGTDLGMALRASTRGYNGGGFGAALDLGGYARFWGSGSTGFAGAVNLGAPLGLVLSLQSHVGTNEALGFGAVAGLDLLRLTVYRQSLLEWWQNPKPAQRVGSASR